MQNGRYSPDRFLGDQQVGGSLLQRLYVPNGQQPLAAVLSGLFFGADTITLMPGVTLDFNDGLRASKLTVTNQADLPTTVTVTGLTDDGQAEDANRVYSVTAAAGGSNSVTIPTTGAGSFKVRRSRVGRWSGFSVSAN